MDIDFGDRWRIQWGGCFSGTYLFFQVSDLAKIVGEEISELAKTDFSRVGEKLSENTSFLGIYSRAGRL